MASRCDHPLFARFWPWLGTRLDRKGGSAHRDELVAGLSGTVVEVGCGDGRQFAHYPDAVSEVIAVEPERHLRERAAAHAAQAPVPVRVIDGLAGELPVEDAAADAAVCALVLCSVPDQDAALADLFRVLRPGGELRFYEHVVAEQPVGRAVQGGLDRTGIWPYFAAGCHVSRDTRAAIERAGFTIETVRRFTFPRPGMPHLLGTARRAA